MTESKLYIGNWPGNVKKTAKYRVLSIEGEPKVTVEYDLGEGLKFLTVEGEHTDIVEKVNRIKNIVSGKEKGQFYINEYQHLIVPVEVVPGKTHYFSGGKVDANFQFEFEGKTLTTKPVGLEGQPLKPGDSWVGPIPGIPYVLAAEGKDVYFKSPVFTDTKPPKVRSRGKEQIFLSRILKDRSVLERVLKPIRDIRGSRGGRFYVNEHRAIFTPVKKDDGDGINYVYCGQIDLEAWFPEPPID